MSYWLLVFLFTADGEFMAKDVYETASPEQCQQFAGDVTKTIINTELKAQFFCVSDDEYRLQQGEGE